MVVKTLYLIILSILMGCLFNQNGIDFWEIKSPNSDYILKIDKDILKKIPNDNEENRLGCIRLFIKINDSKISKSALLDLYIKDTLNNVVFEYSKQISLFDFEQNKSPEIISSMPSEYLNYYKKIINSFVIEKIKNNVTDNCFIVFVPIGISRSGKISPYEQIK